MGHQPLLPKAHEEAVAETGGRNPANNESQVPGKSNVNWLYANWFIVLPCLIFAIANGNSIANVIQTIINMLEPVVNEVI